ncbi:hypothetical protein B9Q11_02220 [Candidatus Marsarchaeota G2 archaeon ECH_B_SAG-F08]|uniref:Uncharacterized protein n=6 Tax=Candidatus Marsarchaeota TaxID=1978152 RepID=A0A2R6BYN5_9ARCH|nr:MAG: hypothetical protein B9Q01_08325 [Candidatus Marsarchaeota G1 archaeon OSP_D]PSN83701.1 MAG: hypothetical protein B9Q02_10255 [Candidatus Marsarchaeota G1 archaeon BE_D]PSN88002.1 MAG: hypothetical protein B9Q00_07085 [Candidatus Marsarchaeota G1 archaeon OSP_C]PSN93004.1 MAG: hypothetical protein B9P99_02895 [Candidatus Marsarchaeota G1 archaeon OSP_B]PSN98471.1 MAG: hypothetical protein B9Q11_02220 [Candidatus Marsarchaeota G2 archaeon ECH_B_SAG-F08]PSO03733.1 MAG: hypothetical prote
MARNFIYLSVFSFREQLSRRSKNSRNKKPRLEHFNLYENIIRITDRKLGRIVDVYYVNHEMYCELCETTECVHTGYAWSVYEHYTEKC